jgi:8-oxo-dGTP pyrophosphatase MutT (NUDIX family)
MAKLAGTKSTGTKSTGTKSAQARVLSSRISYQGPVFSVTTDEVEEPGGVRARRDVIRHSGSIVVLAVDDPAKSARKAEPRILLERQYRHAAQSMMWELPAGRIDDGETALTAAKRELLEETGYTALHWKRILHFYVSPRFSRRNHDHLPGSRPPSRQGPARAGREDRNEIFCLVRGETDGPQWAHPRCQNHLRHPMAGPDAATSAVGWPSIFATPGGDGASPSLQAGGMIRLCNTES